MNSYVPHSQLRFTMRFQHHLFTKPCAVQFSYGVAPNNPRARGQQFQLVSSTINVRQAPKCWQAFSTWFGRRHPVFIVTTVTVNSLWMVSCGKKSAWLIKAMAFRHGCFESCQSDIRQSFQWLETLTTVRLTAEKAPTPLRIFPPQKASPLTSSSSNRAWCQYTWWARTSACWNVNITPYQHTDAETKWSLLKTAFLDSIYSMKMIVLWIEFQRISVSKRPINKKSSSV